MLLRSGPRAPQRRGAAAVELAVVLSFVLIPAAYGMIELSRAIQVKDQLTDATRSGCRLAIQPGASNSTVTANINAALTAQGFNPANATVTILVNGQAVDVSTAQPGDQISVKVSLPAATVGYVLPLFMSSNSVDSETLVMMRLG